MARIVEHLSIEGLEARYRAARDATEARHVQAIWLLARGRSVLDVAGVLAFAPRWVEELAARYNAHGPDALGDQRRRNGRVARADLGPAGGAVRAPGGTARGRRTLDRPQGGALDGRPARCGAGARAARLGGAATGRLVGAGTAATSPAISHARAAGRVQRGLAAAVAQAGAAHPGQPIEVWAEDEHRLGLKPVRRRVWAPKGARPTALGHHRYKWLHVTAFVQPTTGEVVWFLSTGLSKPFFAALLAAFAQQVGAGRARHVVLVLDNAGWHGPEGLTVPDGITLVFLPPYSPELQPAERLWPLVDEPVANRHFATLDDLDAVVAERCCRLDPATIRPHTSFHWWPKPAPPN